MMMTNIVDEEDTISIDSKASIRNSNQILTVISRPPLEIFSEDDVVPPPIVNSILHPNLNLNKDISQIANTPTMATLQKQMIQFFEGEDCWEDVDEISNWKTINNGNLSFADLVNRQFRMRRPRRESPETKAPFLTTNINPLQESLKFPHSLAKRKMPINRLRSFLKTMKQIKVV